VEIDLTNPIADRRRLAAELAAFAREHGLTARVLQAADLALEEHLTNISGYGYDNAPPHSVRVRLNLVQGWLEIEVEDDGRPFNPLQAPAVDTSVPLERKPVGGLGIHLMRRFMDEIRYRRERDRNIVTMRKRLDPAGAA
jgi:anti-sigma regulatory factor (Ser/Thr protein kinase)